MQKLTTGLLLAMLPAAVMASPVFTLQSKDFSDNAVLARQFAGNNKASAACTGDNVSPALNWSAVPAGTQSFALVLTDPVGAKGLGVTHMVAYNIAADRTGFAQGELSAGKGYTGGKNSPGTSLYYGPCPPAGSGLHHYIFVLIATDLPANQLPPDLTRDNLFSRLQGHTLGSASLVGRFGND